MSILRDHPDIEWTERTGYPEWNQPQSIYCGECAKCLDDEDIFEDAQYEHLCEECLLRIHRKW